MVKFFERLYVRLYTKVGGRPWTEIVRADQKASPLTFMLIFFFLGILVVKVAGKYWWQILLVFLFGLFVGHLWW